MEFECIRCGEIVPYSHASVEMQVCAGCYEIEEGRIAKEKAYLEKQQIEQEEDRNGRIENYSYLMGNLQNGGKDMIFIRIDSDHIVSCDNIITIKKSEDKVWNSDMSKVEHVLNYIEVHTRDGEKIFLEFPTAEERNLKYEEFENILRNGNSVIRL